MCALLPAAGRPARHAVRAHVLSHVSAQLPARRAERAARRHVVAAAGPRAPRAVRGPLRPLPAPAVPTAHQPQVSAARLHSAAQVRYTVFFTVYSPVRRRDTCVTHVKTRLLGRLAYAYF